MKTLSLYCKSYFKDVERALNLFESIQKFNRDQIPFYVSVPERDRKLFQDRLGTQDNTLISDEDIVGKTFDDSWVTQQIVKSQFYQVSASDVVVVLDSDEYFIRDFSRDTFLFNADAPYTVMNECKDYLQFSARHKLGVQERFREKRLALQKILKRPGRPYDYGTSPYIFDRAVWRTFHEKVLPSLGMSVDKAFRAFTEAVCYGETVLKFEPIKLVPVEPLFKCFHVRAQYEESKNLLGITEAMLAETYDGIVMQSYWDAPVRY